MTVPRLAAIDLDGTLLQSDGTVSGRTRTALADAQAGGLTVVLVSGRHPAALAEVAADAAVGGFGICSNGANVLDLDSGCIVRVRPIQTNVALRLVRALRERAPGVLFAAESEAELAFARGIGSHPRTPATATRLSYSPDPSRA